MLWSNLEVILYLRHVPFAPFAKPRASAVTQITLLGLEPFPHTFNTWPKMSGFLTPCLPKFHQAFSWESLFLHCWLEWCSEIDISSRGNSIHLAWNVPMEKYLYPTYWIGLCKAYNPWFATMFRSFIHKYWPVDRCLHWEWSSSWSAPLWNSSTIPAPSCPLDYTANTPASLATEADDSFSYLPNPPWSFYFLMCLPSIPKQRFWFTPS